MTRRTQWALGLSAGAVLLMGFAWLALRRRRRRRKLNATIYAQELQAQDGGIVRGQIEHPGETWVSTFSYSTPDERESLIRIMTWPSESEAMSHLQEQYAEVGIAGSEEAHVGAA